MIPHSELLADLQAEVPAVGGVPTSAQYDVALRKAISDFSRRAGPVKRVTISIVANTASYDLPDAFIDLIRMEMPAIDEVYPQPGGQLIPLNVSFREEQFQIVGTTVTFFPTPQYNMDRIIWYRSAHVKDESNNYPDMTQEEADIILLKARSNATRYIHMSSAPDGWRYSIGDVTVDKSGQARSLKEVSKELHDEYEEAVEAYIGAVGSQAHFTQAEQANFLDVNRR